MTKKQSAVERAAEMWDDLYVEGLSNAHADRTFARWFKATNEAEAALHRAVLAARKAKAKVTR